MMKASLDSAEELEIVYQAIKVALDKKAKKNPAALMIQRQFRVFTRRKCMRQAVEARKAARRRAALKIQSWYRGYTVRQTTKYGVRLDKKSAMAVKARLD